MQILIFFTRIAFFISLYCPFSLFASSLDSIPQPFQEYLHSATDSRALTTAFVNKRAMLQDVVYFKNFFKRAYGLERYLKSDRLDDSITSLHVFAKFQNSQIPTKAWQMEIAKALDIYPDQHLAIYQQTEYGSKDWQQISTKKDRTYTSNLFIDSDGEFSTLASGSLQKVSCHNIQSKFLKTYTNGGFYDRIYSFSPILPNPLICSNRLTGVPLILDWIEFKSAIQPKFGREPDIQVVAKDHYTLVKIPSFNSFQNENASTILSKLEPLQFARTIVFDMRGNTGGKSSKTLKKLSEIFGVSIPSPRFQKLYSPWTLVSSVNFFTRQIHSSASSTATKKNAIYWRSKALQELSQFNEEDHNYYSWEKNFASFSRAINTMKVQNQTKKVYILTDQFCASACELFIKALKITFHATVIGYPTSGTAISGENGADILPGSKLRLQYGKWVEVDMINEFQNFREGRGFVPNVFIDLDTFKVELFSQNPFRANIDTP